MRRKFLHAIVAFFPLLAVGACDLSPEIELSMTLEDVTTTYNNTMARATAVYMYLPNGLSYVGGDAMLASACDEAEHTNEGNSVQMFNTGSWSQLSNPDDAWARCFNGIYAANLYLENCDDVDLDYLKYDSDESVQAQYELYVANLERAKYEVRFLRAFYYFELVQRYGAVPVMERTYDVADEAEYRSLPRTPLADCFSFIVRECDEVADFLPARYGSDESGRATKGAALALKSRALLFAASDLYHDPSWAGGFAGPELISIRDNDEVYVGKDQATGADIMVSGSDRTALWDAAAQAAKAVIDLTDARYTLLSNYSDIFLTAATSMETILVRRIGNSTFFESTNYSVGFDNGNSGTTPSQNLVDAFETLNGQPFNWDDPAMAANPYEDRDPRLDYAIITNYSTFKDRTMEIYAGGRDGAGITHATRTGYYLKKYVDPNVDLIQGKGTNHSWIIFRFAEMYLNYAEAMNEAYGPNDNHGYGLTAIDAINRIRQRIGVAMPAVPTSITKDEFRDKVRNERRVELCFEGHRMFDVRRWMIAEDALGAPLRGVSITQASQGNFSYTPINVENRVFQTKMYFYPIPQTDQQIAGWTQNPLW